MKKFIAFLLFASFAAALQAQTFRQADLTRLLASHPLMKNYDAKRGCFNNTPNEIRDVLELEDELEELEQELSELEEERENCVSGMFSLTSDENAAWADLSTLDKTIFEKKYQILQMSNLIQNGGIPGEQTLLDISRQIRDDILKQFSDDEVVLNKLPKTYYPQKPDFFNYNLYEFFNKADPALLGDYLSNTAAVGLLFSGSDNVVLYERKR